MTNDYYPHKDKKSTDPDFSLKDRNDLDKLETVNEQQILEENEFQQESSNNSNEQIHSENEQCQQETLDNEKNQQVHNNEQWHHESLNENSNEKNPIVTDSIGETIQNDEKIEAINSLQEDLSKVEHSTESKESDTTQTIPEVTKIQVTESVVEYEERTAGFWIRFWAFITDSLIVSAVVGILINPIFYIMHWDVNGSTWYAPITIISAIFYYTYFVVMTKIWQQTVGKIIFGLKVVPVQGEKLSWSTVLFRELVGRFINNTPFFLPYIVVAFTPKNIGCHDYFADTYVIQEKVYVKKEKKIVKQIEVNDSIHPTA